MVALDPITLARFWSKVDVGASNACWTWRGAKDSGGYGSFKAGRPVQIASRLAWEIINGESLGGHFILPVPGGR